MQATALQFSWLDVLRQRTAILKHCGRERKWRKALAVFRDIVPSGASYDIIAYNAVMHACVRGQSWELALSLFAEIQQYEAVQANIITVNTAISACAQGAAWLQAICLLCSLSSLLKVPANVISCTACISACAQGHAWPHALALLSGMRGQELVPNAMTHNAAIAACGRGTEWVRSLQLLQDMRLSSTMPTVVSFGAIALGCAKAHEWRQALHLLKSASDNAVRPDVALLSSVLSAFERRSVWAECLCLLDDLRAARLQPDLVGSNAALAACANSAQWACTLELFDRMMRGDEAVVAGRGGGGTNVGVDAISLNVLLGSYAKGQRWEGSLALLKEANEHAGLAMDNMTYGIAAVACASGEAWRQALRLVNCMRMKCLQPDLATSGPVLRSALRSAHRPEASLLPPVDSKCGPGARSNMSTSVVCQSVLHECPRDVDGLANRTPELLVRAGGAVLRGQGAILDLRSSTDCGPMYRSPAPWLSSQQSALERLDSLRPELVRDSLTLRQLMVS